MRYDGKITTRNPYARVAYHAVIMHVYIHYYYRVHALCGVPLLSRYTLNDMQGPRQKGHRERTKGSSRGLLNRMQYDYIIL